MNNERGRKIEFAERRRMAKEAKDSQIDEWNRICPKCEKPASARTLEKNQVYRIKHTVVRRNDKPLSAAKQRSPNFNGSSTFTTTTYCFVPLKGFKK